MLLGRDFCTPSTVAFVRYLPEEAFLIASKSLSCSSNGPSGDPGRIKQLFLKMLIHYSANMLTCTNVPL